MSLAHDAHQKAQTFRNNTGRTAHIVKHKGGCLSTFTIPPRAGASVLNDLFVLVYDLP